jgi:murein DD-endopeptidase MepM/ murein hydrolase activator NlpD
MKFLLQPIQRFWARRGTAKTARPRKPHSSSRTRTTCLNVEILEARDMPSTGWFGPTLGPVYQPPSSGLTVTPIHSTPMSPIAAAMNHSFSQPNTYPSLWRAPTVITYQMSVSLKNPVLGSDGTLNAARAGQADGRIGAPRRDSNGNYYPHQGIDITAHEGTRVVAAEDGRVIESRWGDDAGNFVVIRHYDGSYTRYLHLKDGWQVPKGTLVRAGQVIGFVGRTGNVPRTEDTHLHFEVLDRNGTPEVPNINPGPLSLFAPGWSSPSGKNGPVQWAPPHQWYQ